MKISIEDLEVIKGTNYIRNALHWVVCSVYHRQHYILTLKHIIITAKDENVRKIMREIEHLTEDCTKLQQILDIILSLR